MENQLVQIVNQSGLDTTKAQVLLANFSNYFEIAADWERKAQAITVTSEDQIAEMKMAGEGRKFLKAKRVAVEHTRKSLKENALREGQTIDAIAKVLTNLIVPIEDDLEQKEKFVEIQEAKRREARRLEREKELEPLSEFIPFGIDLLNMSDDDYNKLLDGAKLQQQAKAQAEADRIKKEKEEAAERERMRLENERLRKEAEEHERQMAEEREKAEAARKKAEEEARIERERADAERKKIEEVARVEREKAEAARRKLQEEARKEAEKAAIEKARLEAALRAKEEEEMRAKRDAEAKAEAERKAKADAEKKALRAPDKEKLSALCWDLAVVKYPEVKDDSAKNCVQLIKDQISASINLIQGAIAKM